MLLLLLLGRRTAGPSLMMLSKMIDVIHVFSVRKTVALLEKTMNRMHTELHMMRMRMAILVRETKERAANESFHETAHGDGIYGAIFA